MSPLSEHLSTAQKSCIEVSKELEEEEKEAKGKAEVRIKRV